MAAGAAAMTNPESLRRLVKFLVVGAWNTAVGYAIFVGIALLYADRLHHQLILAISFAISVVHAYLLQRYFVFKSRNPMLTEFPRFVVVNLSALAINAVLLEVLVRFSFTLLVAQLIATIATTLVQFVAHQAWSFKDRSPPSK
jgi:putative flippase GtrA